LTRKKLASTLLDDEDLQKLEDLSRVTGHSISSLIREAVKEWLKKRQEE